MGCCREKYVTVTSLVFTVLVTSQLFSRFSGSNAERVAAGLRDPRSILLRAETINVHTTQAMREEKTIRRRGSGGAQDERTFLVHLEDAGNEQQRRAVSQAAGQALDRYIPHNTFLLDLSPAALLRTQALVGGAVVWMGELQPRHKLASSAIKLYTRVKAERDAALVVKLRVRDGRLLAAWYERDLLRAGLPVRVTVAGAHKLVVRRRGEEEGMELSAAHARVHALAAAGGGSEAAGGGERSEGSSGGGGGTRREREGWVEDVAAWLSEEGEVLYIYIVYIYIVYIVYIQVLCI
jgi:hypothetical protein